MTPKAELQTELFRAIETERKQVQIRALDISFQELAGMYESSELVIRPEYQRGFRWSEQKQSQWIESILLSFPLPPIYAIESESGHWELIDGLQRLSSYLHFCGKLHDPDRDPPIFKDVNKLRLIGCDVVHELNERTYEDLGGPNQYSLRRAAIRVELFRKDTDPRYLYHMFKRLNTGGETLSDQEVRNCTIRLLGNRFNELIQELAGNADFLALTEPLSEPLKLKMFREEQVLRFFALKNDRYDSAVPMSVFLTDYLEAVTEWMNRQAKEKLAPNEPLSFDRLAERTVFEATMKALASSLGSNTAKRPLPTAGAGDTSWRHLEGFHTRAFEVIALAVARAVPNLPPPSPLEKIVTTFKLRPDFTRLFDPLPERQFYGSLLPHLVARLEDQLRQPPV